MFREYDCFLVFYEPVNMLVIGVLLSCLMHSLRAGSEEPLAEGTESPDKSQRIVWRSFTCWEITLGYRRVNEHERITFNCMLDTAVNQLINCNKLINCMLNTSVISLHQ